MKNKIIKSISLLCLAIITALTFVSCSREISAGFENGNSKKINGWKKYNYEQEYSSDNDASIIGIENGGYRGNCLVIDNKVSNDARVYKKISVKPESIYEIRFWVKTENVTGGAGACLSCYDGQGTAANTYDTSGWQEKVVYLQTKENQKSVNLALGVGGYGSVSSGKAYFDSLTVKKIDKAPAGSETTVFNENEKEKKVEANIWFKLLFVTALVGGTAYCVFLSVRSDKENAALHDGIIVRESVKFDRKDWIIVGILTLITALFSFYKLGSTKGTPNTYWKAANDDEYIVVNFTEETAIDRVVYFTGIERENGLVRVQYLDETGAYIDAFEITKDDVDFYKWKEKDASFTTTAVRIYAERAGLWLNEIGFYKKTEDGKFSQIIVDLKNTEASYTEAGRSGKAENLFDEQDQVRPYHDLFNSTYFDEIYFPRTAYEHINGLSIYERTHPPMGKNFMALGILTFGMNTFGWRFSGTVFGILLVPLMYFFARKVFKKHFWAFGTAFLIMFDFMRLAQTRLATIDSYACFFTVAMYYFMYDYFVDKSYDLAFKKSLKPLLFCGIMFGLGAASKWTCLYSGAGLAIVFFAMKIAEFADVRENRALVAYNGKNVHMTVREYLKNNFIPTCLCCVFFFILIPGVIYVLSYIPYMPSNAGKPLIQIVLDNQKYMYNYHSNLTATHSYGSPWYTWPVMVRPIWYFVDYNVPEGMRATINSFGNPCIWWLGVPCVIAGSYIAWRDKDKKMGFFLVGYLLQYAPWFIVTRVCFIYHYFTALPFTIFFIIYVLKSLVEKKIIPKWVVYVYFGLVFVLFVIYYPILTGIPVRKEYSESLELFSTWFF